MSQIIETTKLYINGEKVFPVSSNPELVADYTDAGYIPSDVANAKQSYNTILSRKTLDIHSIKESLGYSPVAFPDLSMDDYDEWNLENVSFEGCGTISFKDGKFNINFLNRDIQYTSTIDLRDLQNLKELNIINFWGYEGEGIRLNNSTIEKATINYRQVNTSEEPYSYGWRQNVSWTFDNCKNLKSVTMNFPEYSFSQTWNFENMLSNCTSLEEFHTNNDVIDLNYNEDYSINMGNVFSNCESLKTIPHVTGFNHVSNATNMFKGVGWKYKNDLSVRTIDYEINSLSDGIDKDLTNLEGMFAKCPLLRHLIISCPERPYNGNIFRFDDYWESGLNFGNAQPIYEENTSNIIGYHIPDLYTQNFCDTVKLFVHYDNVQWWKDELKRNNSLGAVLDWYIDNRIVQQY